MMRFFLLFLSLIFLPKVHATPANLLLSCKSANSSKELLSITISDVFTDTDLVLVTVDHLPSDGKLSHQDIYIGSRAFLQDAGRGLRKLDQISSFIQLNHVPSDGVLKQDTLQDSGLKITWMNFKSHRLWKADNTFIPLDCVFPVID